MPFPAQLLIVQFNHIIVHFENLAARPVRGLEVRRMVGVSAGTLEPSPVT